MSYANHLLNPPVPIHNQPQLSIPPFRICAVVVVCRPKNTITQSFRKQFIRGVIYMPERRTV